MLLKQADDKSLQIETINNLFAAAPENRKQAIETELRAMRAGIKAEQEAAYLINFAFAKSKNTAIIHDLRLEIDGRVAQIDHILLHRTLRVFVLETKYFHAGLKITEEGEFLRWNDYKKKFEGMPSPFAQNERHMEVLKDAFARVEMPTRLGVRLSPSIYPYVLVSTNTRIDRPQKFDTTRIIKADMIKSTIEKHLESAGLLDSFGYMARALTSDTLAEVGQKMIELHRPIRIDYEAKFQMQSGVRDSGSSAPTPAQPFAPTAGTEKKYHCHKCNSTRLSIQNGKYGYYFKCSDCHANTRIKVTCGNVGHKGSIRKDGRNFYHDCKDCGSRELFFVNPESKSD